MAKINVNSIDWEQEEDGEQIRGGSVRNTKVKKHKHHYSGDVNDDFYKPRSKKMNKPHRMKKDYEDD